MISKRQAFLNYLAPTSDAPMSLEIESAKGVFMYGPDGKNYLDLISGVSVSYLGHSDPRIIKAVKDQADKHLHLMVYGEFIQSPQVAYAKLLAENLPPTLQNVYFVNSGAEAIEGAMKLSKRFTGRAEIAAFRNAYHGSTQGALSILGNEYYKSGFRPLLPGISFLKYNCIGDLGLITSKTACVVVEILQAEAGVIASEPEFMRALRKRCNETGTLLVFDEIQTGFGRLGEVFGFHINGIVPDILVLAKSLGGGMPLGAFISSEVIMKELSYNPSLGHITTFGGHPVACAAGLAAFSILLDENLHEKASEKEQILRKHLQHPKIEEIRGRGLLLAVELGSAELMHKVVKKAIDNGLVTDWFLFCETAIRISPALNITTAEIEEACSRLKRSIDEALLTPPQPSPKRLR
jgi:acetylornithine/N-succinyldiaminopimelate aminotransferase